MKPSRIFSAYLALSTVVLQGCTGYERDNIEVNIAFPTFTSCGGVFPLFYNSGVGASAHIAYKKGKPFSPNEFCVWTFLAEDTAGEVRIDFYDNIYEDDNDGIVVYTWKDSNFTSRKIPHGNSRLEMNAQHFAVAFSSNYALESSGISFTVVVLQAGDGVTNPKAFFSGQTNGEFTYPKIIGQDSYKDNKRVSVVLHGPTETPRQTRAYSLRDLDTEENYDFVEIYVLWPYQFKAQYKFVGRFSGQESGAVANSDVITPFPVLYLFSSSSNATRKGFTIMWKLFENSMD